ncbi:hypothetical protein, partial [Pseudoalteromonas issachenkonii]|uniref:hypothetical protein n=1 Tax=Pseudoalteromonas issachenkonii TaxID=152297 RepID=UPI0023565B6E
LLAYIHVIISKNRAKLPRPAHAPYHHPCSQQRVNVPGQNPWLNTKQTTANSTLKEQQTQLII